MYLVTGATGNVGSNVVTQLLARDKKVKLFTRHPTQLGHWRDRVEVAVGDFEKPESFGRAVADVEAAYLMNGRTYPQTFRALAAAARTAGLRRIVFQSTLFADDPSSAIGQLHKQQEDALREAGLEGKFLRPGGFMSNCFQWLNTIRAEGVVYNPMGTGRFAPVAPEDIAAVGVEVLTEPSLTEEHFAITGGEFITVPEQVEILAAVIGRPIRTVEIPIATAIAGMLRAGLPPDLAEAVGKSYETVRAGRAMRLTDTVQRLTGKPPMTFHDWAHRHAQNFR